MITKTINNSLEAAFGFLKKTIGKRIMYHFSEIEEMDLETTIRFERTSPLARFMMENNPTSDEFLIVLLALAPHVYANFLDSVLEFHLPNGGDFPEFGGVRGTHHRGILPTGETALFILAGDDLSRRLEVMSLFGPDHWLSRKGILSLEKQKNNEPLMSGKLLLDEEYVELFTKGFVSRPDAGVDFAAEYITTEMEWGDVILNPATVTQIREIKTWIRYQDHLMNDWNMARKLKPGYRALFHGPPGTGKTLTTLLLGKETGRDVFRIDLSMVVSKFIGETEKNLSKLFDKAHNKNWILFFDEADSLFGKRTGIRDAHDKYANQEVAYLLQKIENYSGLVVLATNLKTNIDEAFLRRFQSIVYFPKPTAPEREALWKSTLPEMVRCSKDVNLKAIAEKYELTGSNIINIVHKMCLSLLEQNQKVITTELLIENINKEYLKEGRFI